MEETSPEHVVTVVERLQAVSRSLDRLKQGLDVDDALSDTLSELPSEIETLVESIEQKIADCTELREKLDDASTRAKIEKECLAKGDEAPAVGPLRLSHAVVRDTEELIDLLFKVTSYTGVLGRIPSVSTRGLIGQALKKSSGKIGTVRQARERLRDVLRGFEGTCLEAARVVESAIRSPQGERARRGHSKSIAEAGLRRDVRRKEEESESGPVPESAAQEDHEWAADEQAPGKQQDDAQAKQQEEAQDVAQATKQEDKAAEKAPENARASAQGDPVFVLPAESPSGDAAGSPPAPAPKHEAGDAGEAGVEAAAAATTATVGGEAQKDCSARGVAHLWSVKAAPAPGAPAAAEPANAEQPAVDLTKVGVFTKTLNRWSQWEPLVPSDIGDLVEIKRLVNESVLKIRIRGTWKTPSGRLCSSEMVEIDGNGTLDRARLATSVGKIILTRAIRTGDASRTAMECLGIIAPIVRSDLAKEKIAPFFETAREARRGELIEARAVIERIPVLRAECTLEYERAVPRIYNFQVALCGNDETPHFSHVPRIWTAKATGYLAALVTLGMGVGYALTRLF